MDEHLEKLIEIEQRSKTNERRIGKHDEELKDLRNVYVALTQVDDKVCNVEKDVKEIKTDLKDIKEKPAKRYDQIITTIILAVVGAVVGFMIGKIGF